MSEQIEENKEFTPQEIIQALVQDLVELAIQSQKVLSASSVSVPGIEDARLLVAMTNQIIDRFTVPKEEVASDEK